MGIKRDRKALGYAAQDLNSEQLNKAGTTSLASAIQGKLTGVDIRQSSGAPGASSQIIIRGARSFDGNNQPLYVIDGMPINTTADFDTGNSVTGANYADRSIDINPEDIESMSVLTGAAAAALYGSEAANGAIVITTKKANVGKVFVAYSGDFSIGQRHRYGLYNQMNSREMMEFSQEMYEDRVSYPSKVLSIGYAGLMQSYLNKEITKKEFDQRYEKMAGTNTDWFDLLFQNSFSHKHSLSLSGGSEKIQNRTSLGYTDETGEANGNKVTLLTATSNTTVNLMNNKLIVNLLLKGTWRKVKGFAYDVDPFSYAYNTSRVIPMYNEDGSLYNHDKCAEESNTLINNKTSYLYNIQNELDNTGSENNTKTWGTTLDVKWNILPGLDYQG